MREMRRRPRTGWPRRSPSGVPPRGGAWCWRASATAWPACRRPCAPCTCPACSRKGRRSADAPEVQDVVALLDALVSPGHDLSLARALKSPLFGLGDDALVAAGRAAPPARARGLQLV